MATSRFTNGVTNNTKENILGQLIDTDPTRLHTYFNDFDSYIAGDWTVTETQAGATQALTDADGGVLLLTNSAADDDLVALNKVGESFLMESGKKAFFKARFKVSDATQSDFVIGLQITDTTPLDVTDGIFFQKDDGDTNLDFRVEKDGTETATAAVATVADDTFITATWFIDPDRDAVYYSINNAEPVKIVNTNLPDDEELTITIAVQAGAAAAKSLVVDYVTAIIER